MSFVLNMHEDGTIFLPEPMRIEMGMPHGGIFKVSVKDGRIVLTPVKDELGTADTEP